MVVEAAQRWSVEQVAALAPARLAAARALAVPAAWVGTGCDATGLWGRCQGLNREPYDVVVDHVGVAFRCNCPSRLHPCKHAVALLLLWARGDVPDGVRPATAAAWLTRREALLARSGTATSLETAEPDASTRGPSRSRARVGPAGGTAAAGEPGAERAAEGESRPDAQRRRDQRAERVRHGLRELDRWITDRLRTGLGEASLARYGTWDELAARLVDAQALALANRVRRIGGMVGTSPGWHERVLAELGVLHLLAEAGRRIPSLPEPLPEGVAAAVGFTVRQADVLAGVPETDTWFVAGRGDTLEDRITVRRTWLVGEQHGWALVLSFAAYGQLLDDSLPVGASFEADLHRYPGTVPLRALVGRVHRRLEPTAAAPVVAPSIAAACEQVGASLASEPWLEHVPFAVRGAVSIVDGKWWLHDHTGGLALAGPGEPGAVLAACTAHGPEPIVAEWTPLGVVALTVHLGDHCVDVGPRGGFR